MKAVIVSGSHRKESQSRQVADKAAALAKKMGHDTDLIDLAYTQLPLWHEGVWSHDALWQESWAPLSARLKAANAIVIVAPEWAGIVPPSLKNFLLYCDAEEVAHKPGLLVGVSSGFGGAYPIAELRMSGYKNNRICWIPDHVIVRHVASELDKENQGQDTTPVIQERLEYSIKMLAIYADALDRVRQNPDIDYKRFPYGM